MGCASWIVHRARFESGEALALYVEYRKTNPMQIGSSFPEANFYFQHKAYAKVPGLLEPRIGKLSDPNSYRLLAHSYERLGMLTDAKRIWEAYIVRAPEDAPAKNNLERVSKKLGS